MPLRLSWSQPEDLLAHAFVAAEQSGQDVSDLRERWLRAGGSIDAPVGGASAATVSPEVRQLARELLAAIDEREVPVELRRREPDDLSQLMQLSPAGHAHVAERPSPYRQVSDELYERILGGWLGRAAGCLLGKPVEKISRAGIRAIATSTGNWPVRGYFTAVGLDPAVAAAHPWNRRSAATSLVENIAGMPEDDDLNFALVALSLLERAGSRLTTADVAAAWLDLLPAGRVFTAERIAYRNLLAGFDPDVAGGIQNPFGEWIGAQIRADVYGWANPGDPVRAASLAWTDARLSHTRNGIYGAMFVAAACAAAVVADDITDVLDAGLSVVPTGSRYAGAIRRGIELGRSRVPVEDALDALHADFGALHWVHVLNNAALVAFALTRGDGTFDAAVPITVMGGLDTDSDGATVGSLCGALHGRSDLDERWIEPLRDRLASSVPGFDGVSFAELARRTVALIAAEGTIT